MDEFLKMDLFFVVTTVVVLLLGIFLIVAVVYVIRILRNVDHLSRNISEESDHIRTDLGVLRKNVREEGMKISHFLRFFGGMVGRRKKSSKKTD